MCVCVIGESYTVQRVQKYLHLTPVSHECPDCLVKAPGITVSWWKESPALFILRAPAVFVLELHTSVRWAFLHWFLSLLSALNIRFSLSSEKKCSNGYSLMNCRRTGPRVCAFVCLWPVVCEKWTLWLDAEGADEPWDAHLWKRGWLLYHTHPALLLTHNLLHFCTRMSWEFIGHKHCLLHISVEMNVECQSVFNSVGNTQKNVINFRPWFWINEAEVVFVGTDWRVCRLDYMHYRTAPVWVFSIKCIWIYKWKQEFSLKLHHGFPREFKCHI